MAYGKHRSFIRTLSAFPQYRERAAVADSILGGAGVTSQSQTPQRVFRSERISMSSHRHGNVKEHYGVIQGLSERVLGSLEA